jgi:hypothetical protein
MIKSKPNTYAAIMAINPSAVINIQGGVIEWQDIQAKLSELQAEYDANQYQRDRAEEYPTWQDQLDDIYHNGLDAWKATIKATKDKYPKS